MKTVLLGALSVALLSGPVSAATLQALYADQRTDQVIFVADKNGDGDANDPGETQVFFDAENASGLASPTGNVFTMTQSSDGSVYIGDGNTDSVYRLLDRNGDNSAQSAGEASIWFSADENAGMLPLLTPNGVAEGGDGAIYIVEADTVSTPNGDFVYRTQDFNGDGDANDAGEASVWLDLKALNASSSAFDIRFSGDVAYIMDTAGGEPNRIYRAEDVDGDGIVSATEVTEFVTDATVPLGFGLDVLGDTVFALDFGQINALTDLDASGIIDDAGEAVTIWDDVIAGVDTGVTFSLAALSTEEILLTSSTGALFRLLDLNGDGDFVDDGETISFLSADEQGSIPVRPRAVIGYESVAPVPVPPALPAFAAALIVLWWRRRA